MYMYVRNCMMSSESGECSHEASFAKREHLWQKNEEESSSYTLLLLPRKRCQLVDIENLEDSILSNISMKLCIIIMKYGW